MKNEYATKTNELKPNMGATKTQSFRPVKTATFTTTPTATSTPAATSTATKTHQIKAANGRTLTFNPRDFNTKTIESRLLKDNLARQVDIRVNPGVRLWTNISFIFIFPYLRYRKLRKWFFVENRKLLDQMQIIDKVLIQKFNLICNGLNLSRRYFVDDIGFENAIRDSYAFITTPYSNFPIFVAEKDKLISQLDFMWNRIVTNNPRVHSVPVVQELERMIAEIDNELSIQRKFYVIVVREFNSKVQERPLIPARYKLGLFPVLEKDVAKRISVAAFKV